MTRKSASYDDFLSQQLRDDPEFAYFYLNEAIQDGPQALFVALKNVIAAHDGMTKMEEQTGLKRQSLYKMLSGSGNPGWVSMITVLDSLGFSIELKMKQTQGKKRKAAPKKPATKTKAEQTSAKAKGMEIKGSKKALKAYNQIMDNMANC